MIITDKITAIEFDDEGERVYCINKSNLKVINLGDNKVGVFDNQERQRDVERLIIDVTNVTTPTGLTTSTDLYEAIRDMQLSSAQDFQLEVVKGNVVNHVTFEAYGRNPDIDTGTTPEDVWNGANPYTGFPTGAAETMEIFSSSANDTSAGTGAQTVRIFNLLDSSGQVSADIDVSLNGVTPVSLGATEYYRGGTKIKVLTAGSTGNNVGQITLRHTTTTANIFAVMPATLNQTTIAAYTVPLGKSLYIDDITVSLSRANGAAGSANISFKARPFGGVFNALINAEISNGQSLNHNAGWFKFDARTDLKITVESVSDNNTTITAHFSGVLVTE